MEAAVGKDFGAVAMTLRGRITLAQRAQWQSANPAIRATEAFDVERSTSYAIGSPAGCQTDVLPISLPAGYEAKAQAAAALQLEKAGVRLAVVLNRALANVPVPAAVPINTAPVIDATARAATAPSGEGNADHPRRSPALQTLTRRGCMAWNHSASGAGASAIKRRQHGTVTLYENVTCRIRAHPR